MNSMDEAIKIKEKIISWRRDLHQIPEIGLILPQTSLYVKERLEEMGVNYKTYPNHSGIVALIGKGNSDKTIAIRADMDALKINEDVDLKYKSKNDNMHACGHDAHTAILLGVAKILKEKEKGLNGMVKLIFQPAEEGPGGAALMVKDGVLEDPEVDAIYVLHVENMPKTMRVGSIGVSYSTMFAADDQLYINIKGKGGHGALPHESIDPIIISAHIITALQSIISREIKPSDPAVITIASITAGRGTTNVISDNAEILGTIRTLNTETRKFILERIEEIVSSITKGFRADYELKFFDSYPPVINSWELTENFISSAKKIIPEQDILILNKPDMGGEDAAFFFEKVPGVYFLLNTCKEESGKVYPPHNAKFQVDDSVLYIGTALFVQLVLDFFN